ncbi:MAG: hypothetical protein HZA47_03880 [Planctomycetes bacterium]|uniref:hypothetical protein n=1 Tax=Candidatus Wunengus sp. YC65 TaxID=3367701 RepID=UPI001D8C0EB5|nr:hypothetical protein [Planctomycetota bacterium]
MKQTRILTYSCLLISLMIIITTKAVAQTFTLKNTVTIDFGAVWCVPVYDGSNIVVSSESDGTIKVGKFDLSLNEATSHATIVADTADTDNNDTIADHKHIFQNGYHYLVFSTAGSGQGGYLYLLKLDTDLNREDIVTVVNNDPPTNDMFLVGDGTYIYAGKFLPGTGHTVYKYDSNLNKLASYTIGGDTNTHANGAAAVYTNNQFHLVAPFTLAPGQNDEFYRFIFDNDWHIVKNKEPILLDEGMLSIVSALSVEPISQEFIIHYGRGSSDAGGPLYRAVYDSDWNQLSNTQVIDGTWTRPHSVIVNDTLYVGYDGSSSVQLSSFAITDIPTPTPVITTTATPTAIPTAIPSPIPTITSIVTTTITPSPIPTPVCEASSLAVSPTTLTLNRKTSGNVTVTVTGDGNCLVEGETVTATVGASGKKRVSVSPTSQSTNENGQATFTITAKKKTGKARVTFQAAEQKKSITVTVKK